MGWVLREELAGIVSESCMKWGLGREDDVALRPPEDDMLAVHDARTTILRIPTTARTSGRPRPSRRCRGPASRDGKSA